MYENKSFHKLNIFFSKATDDGDMMSPTGARHVSSSQQVTASAARKKKFFLHSSPGNQSNEKAIKRNLEYVDAVHSVNTLQRM